MRVLLLNASFLFLFTKALAFSTTAGPFRYTRQLPDPSKTLRKATDDETDAGDAAGFKMRWQVDDTFATTESGLMFKDTVVGSGESPGDGGTISIHYSMWFDDFSETNEEGTEYFSTLSAKNAKDEPMKPMSIQFGEKANILKGWSEGMETMKPGGKRTLVIPPALGYGTGGLPQRGTFPKIPGNAHLRFEVELLDVDNSFFTKFRRMVPRPSAILE